MASLFLLVSLSLALLCNYQADLISDVCSKAANPSLYTQALTSDPRSRGSDLTGLGQIAITKAQVVTQDAISAFKSFNTGKNNDIVNLCDPFFNEAINDLSECSVILKNFNKGSKGNLQAKGSGALNNVVSCDEIEIESGAPDEVREVIKKAQDLIDVLLVIAKIL